ncbi:NAD(P)/FAD-dependent oxidoreductase [Sagittula sp. S175]|uniref:NAD(P)/FAD-dependent oxidoreductase n=1 Tax=Sagittula sp. S175 TaxID=3415129 RepID=UPI003C7DB46C
MKRLYEAPAYGPAQPYWAGTVDAPQWPTLDHDLTTDTAIIGGGFTGLNCALTLAQYGQDVAVFDAESPGWGASTRNGGFCCLGGAIASDTALRLRYGAAEAALWADTQQAAVDHVSALLDTYKIDADRHSHGETVLAHSPRAARRLARDPDAEHHGADELKALGLGTTWHGGASNHAGFALNPAKYHAGLARAATAAGVRAFAKTPVTALNRGTHWHLTAGKHKVTARRVILATNGYSSEDLPHWLRARTLPVQSSVIVTRPLTSDELTQANWTSDQMAYDTRKLLHYFRKLPEGRFLFGMRGGLTALPGEQERISTRIRRDFHAAFPAWKDVEITHEWSGLVCLMASGHPFAGAVPGHPDLHAALGFHGNGVAMGSYLGHSLAQRIMGRDTGPFPAFLRNEPKRFPLGRYRRALLRPAYWLAETFDL